MRQRYDGHLVRAATRLGRARRETLAHRADAIRVGDSRRDRAVAELARDRQSLGPVGRHVQRNLVVEVDEAAIAMQVADFPAQPFGVVDCLAVAKQIANHSDLLAELGLLDRRQAHHAASRMARAEAQNHAPRRELVYRRDRMHRHRRDPVRRNRHARAEFDLLRIYGGQRHARVGVAPDHVRVGNPRVREAALFGVLDVGDCALRLGENQCAKIHSRSLSGTRL